MNDVIVRCKCRKQIGTARGEMFEPRWIEGTGQQSIAPPIRLALLSTFTGEHAIFFPCSGRDHHMGDASAIPDRVANARRRGRSDVVVPPAEPPT